MASRSPQHDAEPTETPEPSAGAAAFTAPGQLNQRRYEALRAHHVDGLTWAQAGAKYGYTRWAMINMNREWQAGRLTLFTPPGKPGPKNAPRKDAARATVIELRRRGLSVYEISAALAGQGVSLHRSSVGQILAEEGFGRLIRGPEAEASISPATTGRDTRLPRAAPLDFDALPAAADTTLAGLLLVIPDLIALDLPALAAAAGYPGTTKIKAISWILSLLALKLTATRRVSHVDDLVCDAGTALFTGLAALPKKTALTDCSYRLDHDHQLRFLAALDTAMTGSGLATAEQAIFDLDFHAVMHWGHDPALEKHYVPTRSQRARSVLTFFAQDSGTHNLVYANADISKATQAREVIAFCDHWKNASGADPRLLILDQRVTTQPVLAELDDRGVKFLTLRMRSAALMKQINALTPADYKTVPIDRPGRHTRPEVAEQAAVNCPTTRHRPPADRHRPGPRGPHRHHRQRPRPDRQGHHRALRPPDDHRATPRRNHPGFPRRRLSSAVNLNVDLDIMLCVLAQALLAAFRTRLGAGYATAAPDTLQRRFLDTPGHILNNGDTITVRIDRRTYSPVLRAAGLPNDTPVPWWGGRRLHFEYL